ncbi:MAG: hydroxymethylbilane synthase, partial [Armatimonadota bacterium]|nr:hydroxymethylbilane synthase [Armatimonadota bacterium]
MTAGSFVLGTRGSTLAVRQTEAVAAALRRAHPALTVSILTIRTTGDQQPEAPFEALPGIGFFVKELEVALLERRVDAAVHSMKDLPTAATPGLTVCAVTAREDPRDVLVGRPGATLATLPRGARIGTGSPRRAAFVRAVRPDLQIVPIRGNVETRLRKVDAGELDAVIVAGAGLRRLGLEDRIAEWLPFEVILPAPGQGALGVQVRIGDETAAQIVSAVDDRPTRWAVTAERALLDRLQGGCRLPAGAHAIIRDGAVRLQAAVVVPDGRRALRGERNGPVSRAEAVGRALAEDLLARGAGELLRAV